jgi:SSS family transporter
MLAVSLGIYLLAMFGLAIKVHGNVQSAEDFLIAGRRLSFPLATATLFGTWFGAGTLLASTDEVRAVGLRAVAMEPLGAGICLILAGLFFAKRLWNAKLITLADFYRERFGRKAELGFSLALYTYFGWIAAQLVGLAGLFHVFFGLPMWVGVVVCSAVALGYTLLGGMWSVTLTDSVQITILIVGLAMVVFSLFSDVGHGDVLGGMDEVFNKVPVGHLTLIPTEKLSELMNWLNLLVIGSLGNLAGADLFQRVFSSRSAGVAKAACITAGAAYLIVGVAPALLGLAAKVLLPDGIEHSVLPALAKKVLSPGMTVVFTLALVSAVLSTLDSAILSAASVAANNVLRPIMPERFSTLKMVQWCCVGVAGISTLFALFGESAFELLAGSYALNLAGPFVPLVLGMFWRRGDERAAMASFVLGYGITALEMIVPELDPPVPMPLLALAASTVAYVTLALTLKPRPKDLLTRMI